MSAAEGLAAAFEPLERVALDGGWRTLAAGALEPNPYYEPDMLAAAARHLGGAGAMRLLVVRETRAGHRPVALLPIRSPRLRDGILFGAWSLYANPYTSLTIPLLAAECAGPALRTALHRLAAEPDAPDVLHFPLVTEQRGFAALLAQVAAAEGLACLAVERHARPAIDPAASTAPAAPRHRRLDRKARRLAALGAVTTETVFSEEAGFPAALDAFLALEAAGWKGRRGTALACRPDTQAYARQAFSGASQRIMIESLALDGRAIAMNLNLVSGRAVFTVKTAYDETHAVASPGQLLDRHVAERIAADPDLDRADSCAQPDHPMGALWREREPVAALLVGLAPSLPAAALEPMAARMRLASRWRKRLRALRERFGV
jgi:CelD/BcsL family acetyltransferase involved in cellulose biosynthesis